MIFLQDFSKWGTWRWPVLQPKHVVKVETWIHEKKRPVKDQLCVIPPNIMHYVVLPTSTPHNLYHQNRVVIRWKFQNTHLDTFGPGQHNRYSDSPPAGRSGDRIPVATRFSAPVHTGAGAHPPSYTMGNGFLPGVKRPGRGVHHPPPSCAEVKERVQLYLYSTSGSSWPVLGWPLPLPYLDTFLSLSQSRRILSLRLFLLRSVIIIVPSF